ncbi:MAG: hypothetical protein JWO31_211 [Phycisphaerales bacterium]|nr:hypothetical protein [Phycisphaerales bacterium]
MSTFAPPTVAALPAALAAADVDWGKLIGVAFVVVVWLVGAAAKGLERLTKKSGEEPAPGPGVAPPPPIAAYYTATPQYPAPPPIPSTYAASPVPRLVPPRIPSSAAPSRGAKPPKSKKRGATPRLPAVPAMATNRGEGYAAAAARSLQSPPRPAPAAQPPLDAAAIRRWLTPRTLKQQFVLTELFDPPPSAR